MTIRYRKVKYKYVLESVIFIQTNIKGIDFSENFYAIDEIGQFVIFQDYASDGATWALDHKVMARAWFTHDAFCQAMREGHLPEGYKPYADSMLKEIYLEDARIAADRIINEGGWWNKIKGESFWQYHKARAHIAYIAVRKFGGYFQHQKPKILEAP